jgi:MoaA/NifB/PqqE/SkfB family radical SAM enzyme
LSCPGCEPHRRLNKKGLLGWGFLRAADFRRFIDKNPQIRTVELSHSGEIFLNPELGDIIRYAFRKHVSLMAGTGVNLNNVSEAVCADLVKYRFRFLKVAIDGADQKTYVKYRRGGDLKKVIANIKRINAYKKKYKSEFPLLQWQFILFDHNVHQVAAAR